MVAGLRCWKYEIDSFTCYVIKLSLGHSVKGPALSYKGLYTRMAAWISLLCLGGGTAMFCNGANVRKLFSTQTYKH